MKMPFLLLIAARLGAQDPSKPASQPASTPAPAAAGSPVPSTDNWVSGWIEGGYRWRTGVAGSFDTYRSIVNLGDGPKLLATEFTVTDPKHRWFDRIDVRGRQAPGRPQQRRPAQLAQHFADVALVDGQHPQRRVAQHLGPRPAEADRKYQSPHRVAHDRA